MRAVLNTNIVVSGIFFRPSNPGRILNLWWEQKFNLVISDFLYKENLKVLLRVNKKLGGRETLIEKFKWAIKNYASQVEITPQAKICRDKKDNQVLDTAFQGKADFLVSGDKDLLVLEKYRRIPILTPAKFLKEFSK